MNFKGVIFDLDGVLCFTDEYHYLAWSELARKLGIKDFTREDNARQRGVSRMDSLEIVLAKCDRVFTQRQKLELADYKNEIYKKMLDGITPSDLSRDVKFTLDTLRSRGVLLAVGSSSKNTPLILERLGLLNFFDAVADGNDITHSKPHPEVFLLAARRLGLDPVDCLVVEDADGGVQAALTGGFKAAAIGEAAKSGKAHYTLNVLGDLLKIV